MIRSRRFNESAASECCVGEIDTSTIFNRGVVGGVQPFVSRRPRDDEFYSDDNREMENPLGILQRPHGERALSVQGLVHTFGWLMLSQIQG